MKSALCTNRDEPLPRSYSTGSESGAGHAGFGETDIGKPVQDAGEIWQ